MKAVPVTDMQQSSTSPLSRHAPLGIQLRDIYKTYGSFIALDDVSLDINPGEFLTLLGPSGSGKTTLLNIIAGFTRLDRGSLFFGKDDVTLKPVNQRGLGMVFQNYALFPHMTVGENVAFPLKVRKLGRAETEERVKNALKLVQLDHLIGRNVAALSGGQRQRVALARAVVFSPRIVLMDEPLSALDKSLREQMQIEIRHLHAEIGATTIYVTHDQREALTMSDRIAVMNNGKIVQCGTPVEVYERPVNAFVADFIGETTLVPVTRSGSGVRLMDGTELKASDLPAGAADLKVVLRAERILMPDEIHATSNRLPAIVEEVIYQGDSLLILVTVDGRHQVSIRRPLRAGGAAALPSVGDEVILGLDIADTLIVADDEGN